MRRKYYIRNFNGWRALAHAYFGDKHLIYMSNSSDQIKKRYTVAFYEVLQKNEQMAINKVTLEKWIGTQELGHWEVVENLKVPRIRKIL